MKPRVELVYDGDCPNVGQAREVIMRAFRELKLTPSWREYDRGDADSPSYVRGYGSPTILIDARDVAGAVGDGGAACCRLYSHDDGYRGVPALSDVVRALKGTVGRKFGWRRLSASLPSLLALLPVLHCPACWPAYAGLLSALGLGFVSQAAYLMPLTAVMLAVAVVSMGYKASSRHGYLPLATGLAASAMIFAGKFWLFNNLILSTGLVILTGAAVWNARPPEEAHRAKD